MVTRVLVEKKAGFDVEARGLLSDIRQTLNPLNLEDLRIVNCYDFEGIEASDLDTVIGTVLSEPNVDHVRMGAFEPVKGTRCFRMALLPGQYDQRADSAMQCIQLVTLKEKPALQVSKIVILAGDLSDGDFDRIRDYLINPVEAHACPLDIPKTVHMAFEAPEAVAEVTGFTEMTPEALGAYHGSMGFAMTLEDLAFVQGYFKEDEQRDPTVTELKVVDTYWSDHCRHTTFMSAIDAIDLGGFKPALKAYEVYEAMRKTVYPDGKRLKTLMDLATINMKYLRQTGGLDDLDVSDEINACSIRVPVDVDGVEQPWLLMFKNETHNHPTEIEPYGGAATCLGGAIRDPLSGRSYVYQSMRVTGAANPLMPVEETLPGKLPQKVITKKAAAGFSAYGNQIGLATGLVSEVYHPGFMAKRMEVGAVIAAAPAENVVRKAPEAGDVIILLGGKTGRDGVGGATGSSKAHDEDSIMTCGAEVQKGNPPEERKIQRLFRKKELTTLIKKCNDFGAGGVSVAIGELADSLEIDLDAVPKKYEGLDGTEIALSESQERMAVVVAAADAARFIEMSAEENLEATVVARVTDTGRLVMKWRGTKILDIKRAFLDENGVRQTTEVAVEAPVGPSFFQKPAQPLETALADLNICSQKGLVERFDNTIGSATVLMPFGGVNEQTPIQTMVSKLPVLGGETETVSMMSYGYDPDLASWSPFHGGAYAVVDAMAKIVATGGDYRKVRLSLQEYFERLGKDPVKWGKPFSALLGAAYAQYAFDTAAIGGKDSMSGTFKDLNVPPTLIAFAVGHGKAHDVISPEFKSPHAALYLFKAERDADDMVAFEALKKGYAAIHSGIIAGDIVSAYAVGKGGVLTSVFKMAAGNDIGVQFDVADEALLMEEAYGSIVFEMKAGHTCTIEGTQRIGRTVEDPVLAFCGKRHPLSALKEIWEAPLEPIFPSVHGEKISARQHDYYKKNTAFPAVKTAKPKVFVPVFPGTNCEYDTLRAFEDAGAAVTHFVFKNQSQSAIEHSLEAMAAEIKNAQMIALPGGFSAGDEPEGSGKFIASVLRNPQIAEAVMALLKERDGLMLGICNGFQALVKVGLLPYGEIRPLDEKSPTLTFNAINRHVARMAKVRVSSVMSPFMAHTEVGKVYQTAFSHGEGRFYASEDMIQKLSAGGQIATQYVDDLEQVALSATHNINGSVDAIEGITSPCGRIFGKMGHVERMGKHLYKNIVGDKMFDIFKSGVHYFK